MRLITESSLLPVTSLAQNNVDVQTVEPLLFYALALLVVFSSWAIVLSQNIVRMAVYLLLTLSGAAGMYFMLDAEFLAAIQLIVYAGGTLILIVFGVMLTSKNPFMHLQVKPWEKMVAITLGLVIASLLIFATVQTFAAWTSGGPPGAQELILGPGYTVVQTIGRLLLSTYLVPFEIAAVLLLVVMIGAAYMARRRTKE